MAQAIPIAMTAVSMAAQHQKAKADSKAAALQAEHQAKAYQRQQQVLDLQAETEERRLEDERARTLAAQRARFGASGLAGNTGSAGAVLQGLNSKFDEEKATATQSYGLEHQSLLDKMSYAHRSNLLEARNARTQAGFGLAGNLLDLSEKTLPLIK